MNKMGFTLVELLAVIALIAILSGLAIPNVITSVNNSRKASFLMDAKRMVTKAEYLISINKNDRNIVKNNGEVLYSLRTLKEKGDFQVDADGVKFTDQNYDNSFVKVSFIDNEFKYCICLMGSKRKITGTSKTCNINNTGSESGCLDSGNLTSINVVSDN